MRRLLRSAKSFVRESGGQDLIEYVLLVAFIALVLVGAITAAGGEVEVVFNNIANTLGGGGGDGDSGGGGSGDDGSGGGDGSGDSGSGDDGSGGGDGSGDDGSGGRAGGG